MSITNEKEDTVKPKDVTIIFYYAALLICIIHMTRRGDNTWHSPLFDGPCTKRKKKIMRCQIYHINQI
jgi:hypothetical protein